MLYFGCALIMVSISMRANLFFFFGNSNIKCEDLACKINLSPAPSSVASNTVHPKLVVLLLLIHCLLLFSLFVFLYVWSLLCWSVISVFSILPFIVLGKVELPALLLIDLFVWWLLVSCVSPHSAVGWSAECDCNISFPGCAHLQILNVLVAMPCPATDGIGWCLS